MWIIREKVSWGRKEDTITISLFWASSIKITVNNCQKYPSAYMCIKLLYPEKPEKHIISHMIH